MLFIIEQVTYFKTHSFKTCTYMSALDSSHAHIPLDKYICTNKCEEAYTFGALVSTVTSQQTDCRFDGDTMLMTCPGRDAPSLEDD